MSEYAHLVGHRFPAGSYTLPEYVCWLWSDAAALPPAAEAHPALAYLIATYGLGVSVNDILALLDASAEDGGVTFGEFGVEYHRALRSGVRYQCDGESSRSSANEAAAPACSTSRPSG